MTNLEIIKLCAEAMEFVPPQTTIRGLPWNPLVFDEQAMALVKKLRLDIWSWVEMWKCSCSDMQYETASYDLNRAICECVAKMQLAKQKVAA